MNPPLPPAAGEPLLQRKEDQLLSVQALQKNCRPMPTVADDVREQRDAEAADERWAAANREAWAWSNAQQLPLFSEVA